MELLDISKEDFLEIFNENSIAKTAEYFKTTTSNIETYIKAKNIPPHTRKWVGKHANMRKKIDIQEEELKRLFIDENMSRAKVAEHFNCSEALIKKKCRQYGISKGRELYSQNTEKTLMDKYGTTRFDLIGKDKTEQTNIEKYGAKTPFESSVIQAKVSDNKRTSSPSNLEFRVMLILDKLGIPYSREVFYNKPSVMTFDFVIFNNNKFGFIEADGVHHFKNVADEDRVKRSHKRDSIKDNFCNDNEIKLLRINYEQSDEEITQLINNFYNKEI